MLKTPLNYYGGKTKMLPILLPIANRQKVNAEIFLSLYTGGGALEFALEFSKNKNKVEVWNDSLYPLTVFYHCLQSGELNHRLKNRIQRTLYSETNYRLARRIYKRYKDCHEVLLSSKKMVDLSWAVYLMCNMTYASGILKGFSFSRKRDSTIAFKNKVVRFRYDRWGYLNRLKNVCIFNRDAISVLKLYKKSESLLIYADPPYFNSDMGHYGFSKRDMLRLLMHLSESKGRFILSSYPSDILLKYVKKHKWYYQEIDQQLALMTGVNVDKTRKTECITCNFNPTDQIELF